MRVNKSRIIQNVPYLGQPGVSKTGTLRVGWNGLFTKLYSWYEQDIFEMYALIKIRISNTYIHHRSIIHIYIKLDKDFGKLNYCEWITNILKINKGGLKEHID